MAASILHWQCIRRYYGGFSISVSQGSNSRVWGRFMAMAIRSDHNLHGCNAPILWLWPLVPFFSCSMLVFGTLNTVEKASQVHWWLKAEQQLLVFVSWLSGETFLLFTHTNTHTNTHTHMLIQMHFGALHHMHTWVNI